MKLCKIKSLTIGNGLPKICVPIFGESKEQLYSQIQDFHSNKIDFLEWRADFLKDIHNTPEIISIAKEIQHCHPEKPLLFTFRSLKEGGEQELSLEDYFALNLALAQSGAVDLIDLELFCTEDTKKLSSVIHKLQSYGSKVILSNHDFHNTPDEQTIISRLCMMQDLGADIAKIAVMPNNTKDVLTLLSATEHMHINCANIPIITMSMGHLGSISRISGEIFGSAVTFGSLKDASAPGQIPVAQLYNILHTLSKEKN